LKNTKTEKGLKLSFIMVL